MCSFPFVLSQIVFYCVCLERESMTWFQLLYLLAFLSCQYTGPHLAGDLSSILPLRCPWLTLYTLSSDGTSAQPSLCLSQVSSSHSSQQWCRLWFYTHTPTTIFLQSCKMTLILIVYKNKEAPKEKLPALLPLPWTYLQTRALHSDGKEIPLLS